MVEEQRDWTQLPNGLLENIISYLYKEDIKSFCGVCKSWDAALLSQSPWLLQKHRGETTFRYFHPFLKGKKDSEDFVEQVRHAVPVFSKKGWILMYPKLLELFFFNPSTNTVIRLPDLPYHRDCSMGLTFSSTPTSSDCMVIGIAGYVHGDFVTISTFNTQDNEWHFDVYSNNITFYASYCNPVIHNGMVYSIGVQGNLGVYNPKEDEWAVLSNPQRPCRRSTRNYLLNYENELMSVFLERSWSWVCVFKLDKSKMAWEEVNDLGDYALFLSPATTFATKSVGGMFKNGIFLPIFSNNSMVFYSLQTRKFHTFGNLCKETLKGMEVAEQLEPCWIEGHYAALRDRILFE